jgi:hypothetical protein
MSPPLFSQSLVVAVSPQVPFPVPTKIIVQATHGVQYGRSETLGTFSDRLQSIALLCRN